MFLKLLERTNVYKKQVTKRPAAGHGLKITKRPAVRYFSTFLFEIQMLCIRKCSPLLRILKRF